MVEMKKKCMPSKSIILIIRSTIKTIMILGLLLLGGLAIFSTFIGKMYDQDDLIYVSGVCTDFSIEEVQSPALHNGNVLLLILDNGEGYYIPSAVVDFDRAFDFVGENCIIGYDKQGTNWFYANSNYKKATTLSVPNCAVSYEVQDHNHGIRTSYFFFFGIYTFLILLGFSIKVFIFLMEYQASKLYKKHGKLQK